MSLSPPPPPALLLNGHNIYHAEQEWTFNYHDKTGQHQIENQQVVITVSGTFPLVVGGNLKIEHML